MNYTAQFLAKYAGIEPTKPTEPLSDRLHGSFVGFVGSVSGQAGKTETAHYETKDVRVRAILHIIAQDPELRRQLEFEIDERAGILEYDANLRRAVAELEAERMTLESWLSVIDETKRKAS